MRVKKVVPHINVYQIVSDFLVESRSKLTTKFNYLICSIDVCTKYIVDNIYKNFDSTLRLLR